MSDDLRSALLADDGESGIIVEHKGRKVEVRPPTLAQQKAFTKAAKDPKTKELDGVKMLVLSIIGCTYVPGTVDRVFKREDEEALMNKTSDQKSIVGKVARVINQLLSEKPEEVEANFDSDPIDSSSMP